MSFPLKTINRGISFISFEWEYDKNDYDVFKLEKRYGTTDSKICYWGTGKVAKVKGLQLNLCFTFRVVALKKDVNRYKPISYSEEIKVCTLSDITINNFHRAVQKHQTYVLKNCIQTKPEFINMLGKGGVNSVCAAVIHNNDDALRLLLENGGNVNSKIPKSNRTPIMVSSKMCKI